MTTTRTLIILGIVALLFPLNEAYKIMPEKEANTLVNYWIGFDFPLSKDWFVKFLCLQLSLLFSSVAMVLLSKGKDHLIKAACWIWMSFNIWEVYRFFLNFSKDNYMILYLCIPTVFFVVAAIIKYNARHDIAFMIRTRFNNWYWSGWKTHHYFYLEEKKPIRKVQEHEIRMPEPKPRYQHVAERNCSPII
jgi:hypothetical protein